MRRVVLLGASNVTLSFPSLWSGLQRTECAPIEVFAAHGHGRSYGIWNRIGPRELPGIVSCRLWDGLSAQPPVGEPVRALVTDIGNDLMYGIEPEQIAEWVAICLERLEAIHARIVLTQLPIASALGLNRSRFQFFRSLFFPSSRIQFEEIKTKAMRLNQLIVELGQEHHIPTPELRGEWFGLDPIHLRRSQRSGAWQELLSSWFDSIPAATFQAAGPVSSLRYWRQRPHERRWFGRVQSAAQPTFRETDGATLWLY